MLWRILALYRKKAECYLYFSLIIKSADKKKKKKGKKKRNKNFHIFAVLKICLIVVKHYHSFHGKSTIFSVLICSAISLISNTFKRSINVNAFTAC